MLAWLVVLGLLLQVSGKDDLLRCSTDGKPGTVCKCGKKTTDPTRIIGGQDAGGPLPRKLLQFSKAIPHPDYNEKNIDNDIALMKLSEPLDINIYTPLCLPCKNDNFIGKKAWATGWGFNDHINNTFSDVLQEVDLSVVSNEKCNEQFNTPDLMTEAMLCAGKDRDHTICKG